MAEEQLVLRVPPAVAERLREAMRKGGDINADLLFEEGGRSGKFRLGDTSLSCRLVDLPCVVETHKVQEKGTLLKSSDIGQVTSSDRCRRADRGRQMLVVREDAPGTWDADSKDGLTSATRDIRRRRWRQRPKVDQHLLSHAQQQLLRIMNKQAHDGVEYELIEEEVNGTEPSVRKKKKKKKPPVPNESDVFQQESNIDADQKGLPAVLNDGFSTTEEAAGTSVTLPADLEQPRASPKSGVQNAAENMLPSQILTPDTTIKKKKIKKKLLTAVPEDGPAGSAASGGESATTPAGTSKQVPTLDEQVASLGLSDEQLLEMKNLPEDEQRRRVRAIKKQRKEEKRKRKEERRLKKEHAAAAASGPGHEQYLPQFDVSAPETSAHGEDAVAQGLPTDVSTELAELSMGEGLSPAIVDTMMDPGSQVMDGATDLLFDNLMEAVDADTGEEKPEDGDVMAIDTQADSDTVELEVSPRTREQWEEFSRQASGHLREIASIEAKIEQLAANAASAPNTILKNRFLQQKDAQEKLLEKEREKLEAVRTSAHLAGFFGL